MITREEHLPLTYENLRYLDVSACAFSEETVENILFFDIETTGLSAATSYLYLIGCMKVEGGKLVLRQFLAEDLGEEALLIESFLALTDRDTVLVHFNGDGFDIPYLSQKAAALSGYFPDSLRSVDLYRLLRPFKGFLGLDSMRQKSVETFLDFPRKDEKDGGELIETYRDFLVFRKMKRQAEEQRLLELLLLHNHDDVLGLYHILPVLFANALSACCFTAEGCILTDAGPEGEAGSFAKITLALGFSSPKVMIKEGKAYPRDGGASAMLEFEGDRAELYVPVYEGELKLFFKNTKDYYYLPSEDRAIHKSLAAFIDRAQKERAKASNCYEKRAGSYLPAPKGLFVHELMFTKKDRYVFIPVQDLTECRDLKLLKEYAAFLIKDSFTAS